MLKFLYLVYGTNCMVLEKSTSCPLCVKCLLIFNFISWHSYAEQVGLCHLFLALMMSERKFEVANLHFSWKRGSLAVSCHFTNKSVSSALFKSNQEENYLIEHFYIRSTHCTKQITVVVTITLYSVDRVWPWSENDLELATPY